MKRTLKIIGSFLGIIGSMMLIYNSLTGIINSANHSTWDIFDTILLPFSILLFVFLIIILIQVLQNKFKTNKNVINILTIILSFVIGLLFIWFAIVKSDNNLFYSITGIINTLTAILLLYKY